MLLVILGAGASYDSVPDLWPPKPPEASREQERPPLANSLFDTRPIFVRAMDAFPVCKELIPFLRKSGVSVERELARFQQQALSFPRAFQELAAVRYYLHSALWECQAAWQKRHHGITNYASFLREIERWRCSNREAVCFVTFNYDTMLEEAMCQVLGFQTSSLNAYFQQNYSLVKLHGSINWGREIDNQSVLAAPHTYNIQRLIAEAATLQISDRYTLVESHPMGRVGAQQRFVFPALSIPVESKDEFNCPLEHVERLKELLPDVTRIITIGWRGAEANFLTLLFNGLRKHPNLMIVSGDDDGCTQTAKAFGLPTQQYGLVPPINHNFLAVPSGFTNLVLQEGEQLEHFLKTGFFFAKA